MRGLDLSDNEPEPIEDYHKVMDKPNVPVNYDWLICQKLDRIGDLLEALLKS